MKNIIFLSFLLGSAGITGSSPNFINPTGTYLLKGIVKNRQIVSHYGELRVRLLDSNTMAIAFYINKGYPNYEWGALMDTLPYQDNRAVYKPSNDTTCAIYFAFDLRSAEVSQVLTNPRSACGFRPGVIIPAIFEKTSSDVPVIQDLSVHGGF